MCYVVSMSVLVSFLEGCLGTCLVAAFTRLPRWCLALPLFLWVRFRVGAVVGEGVGWKAVFRRVLGTMPVRKQFAMKGRIVAATPGVAKSLHLYERGSGWRSQMNAAIMACTPQST